MTKSEQESPWVPLVRLSITESDVQRVSDVIRSEQLVQGPQVEILESLLADRLGTRNAILVSSGTAALHLALLSVGIGPGDEVIVPAFSFVASANSVVLTGADPVFVDIRLPDCNIDVGQIETAVTQRTRAILLVHEFGTPADLEAVQRIASERDLLLIEDAACALGATFHNQPVGTFGIAGCFSFHPRKVTTSGEGGMIVTELQDVAESIRSLRSHGVAPGGVAEGFINAGFNYRLPEINAALMVGQVERLDANLAQRARVATRYLTEIVNPSVVLPESRSDRRSSWQTFHIMVSSATQRDQLAHHLKSARIASGAGAQCIPDEPYYSRLCLSQRHPYANARIAKECGLALPISDRLSELDVTRVISSVNSFGGTK